MIILKTREKIDFGVTTQEKISCVEAMWRLWKVFSPGRDIFNPWQHKVHFSVNLNRKQ